MKNCILLNRIAPQALQSLRNFTNESAENLGTKLCNGHASTIVEPAIARRIPPPKFTKAPKAREVSSMVSTLLGVGALKKLILEVLCGELYVQGPKFLPASASSPEVPALKKVILQVNDVEADTKLRYLIESTALSFRVSSIISPPAGVRALKELHQTSRGGFNSLSRNHAVTMELEKAADFCARQGVKSPFILHPSSFLPLRLYRAVESDNLFRSCGLIVPHEWFSLGEFAMQPCNSAPAPVPVSN